MKVDEASVWAAGSARPERYADPRSLSQAWYDALYPDRARAAPSVQPVRGTQSALATASTSNATQSQAQLRTSDGLFWRARGAFERQASRVAQGFGGPGAALQRVATRRLALRISAPHEREATTLHVELEQSDGPPLRLLFQTIESSVRVVAACSRLQRNRIVDALHRTRAALGARGISFTYEVHDA